jgi:hypothetical protein
VATDAQIRANRQNALKSTGPRTDEGKEVSRRNALKHGLTAVEVVPDEDMDVVERRVAAYRERLQPEDLDEEVMARQMAVDSVIGERCGKVMCSLIVRHAQRAEACWDLDRRAEAEELAAKLARDPARVCHALRATRHGCELLAERWEGLGRVLEHNGGWNDAQNALALDLLGIPHELRDGFTPTEGDDLMATRREMVAAERDRLIGLKTDGLDEWDECERERAEKGITADLSPEITRLRRYEMAVQRRWFAAFRYFQRRDRNNRIDNDNDDNSDPPPVHDPETDRRRQLRFAHESRFAHEFAPPPPEPAPDGAVNPADDSVPHRPTPEALKAAVQKYKGMDFASAVRAIYRDTQPVSVSVSAAPSPAPEPEPEPESAPRPMNRRQRKELARRERERNKR